MRSTRGAVVTAVLAVLGLAVSLTALWPRPTTEPSGSGAGAGLPSVEAGLDATAAGKMAASGSGSTPAADVRRRDSALSGARAPEPPAPVRVSVGGVDIDLAVRPVGVAANGQMQLPPRPTVLGWYRFGPEAGAGQGSVVIAGHLDSRRYGLGPLVRLRQLQRGETVRVVDSDGSTLRYRVVELRRFDRQGLPSELFSRTGPEQLRLITCGGEYDAANGGYQENLVVTAVPV